jgi:hypothetical protein
MKTNYQITSAFATSPLPDAGAQIFFQPGEGAFKGVVVLPVREIGDVIFADFFRQIFAGVRVQTLPFFQRRVIRQRDGKRFAPPFRALNLTGIYSRILKNGLLAGSVFIVLSKTAST